MHSSKVPKVLSSIQDIQNPQTSLLKQEMKKFIIDIQQQFDSVISGYEKQLSQLKKEISGPNEKKSKISVKNTTSITMSNSNTNANKVRRSNSNVDRSHEIDEIQQWMLPLNSNDFNLSTSSPFYRTPKRSWKDVMSPLMQHWGSTVRTRDESPVLKKNFTLTMKQIDQNVNTSRQPFSTTNIESNQRSRYQCKSQIKKQRQQSIVHCLQSQKQNLNQMTSRMMTMVGRDPRNMFKEQTDLENQQNLQQISQLNQSKFQDCHNRSLSNICGSLDNSFVSQQTRKAKLKKKLLEEENRKKKEETQMKNEKVRRQRAVKNLLSRLRQNANSVQPPQTVKGSKLLSVGTGQGISIATKTGRQKSPLRKNSKVLINPVPVSSPSIGMGIGEASDSFISRRESFIQQRPTSILKQSSNILTRSISGISAVEFNQ